MASTGSLTLNALTLSNGLANDGVNGGGAVYSHGSLSVTASTFTGNSSPATTGTSGGAINSSGTLTVTTSTFSGNSAQEGGGIFNQNSALITNSTFTNNTALIFGGGALLNAAGTETLAGDTFVGNTGPGGGAIDNDTVLNISDSTFFNNTGGSNGGGAIENFGTTTLTQSTFSGNTSPFGANIFNYTGYTLSMTMDIVTNGQVGNNCGGQAPINDLGYNIDSGSSCGFGLTNHSMSNSQAQLEALASNGGPTQTMAPSPGSPAIDAILPSTPGCTGTTDQRGIARPQGTGCDIGAFETIVTTGDTQAPTVPTGLVVTSVAPNSVSLSWNASSDDIGVTGYTVYRNGTSVGGTAGASALSFTDLSGCAGHQLHVHGGCVRRRRQSLRSIGAGIDHDTDTGRNPVGPRRRDLHFDAGEQHDDRAPTLCRQEIFWLAGSANTMPVVRCRFRTTSTDNGLGVLRRRPLAGAGISRSSMCRIQHPPPGV